MNAPRLDTMCAALRMAGRAPSVHNSQPWLWALGDHSVHLYIDRSRMLPVLDPTGRELVISCGAALHHARIAFAAVGWPVTVRELPRAGRPDHLATLAFTPSTVDRMDDAPTAALAERRSDRRPFRPDPVPDRLLTALAQAARQEGAALVPALDDRSRAELVDAVQYAGSVHRELPEYWREFEQWAGGNPARDVAESHTAAFSRDLSVVTAGELPVPVLGDGAVLAVLATQADSYESWLRAGAALSAVLIEATGYGLATCTLSQIGEVADSRLAVRRTVLGDTGQPQLAVRIGWPVTKHHPGPRSPRRPVSESIEQLRAV
jgi:nitroreductase